MLKIKNLLILFALIAALLMPAGAWAYNITQTNIGELQTAIASADEDIVIGEEITLEDVIAISKDVTIKFSGSSGTIKAAAGKRHFNITSGTTTFEGITFDGNNGGGIEITGGSATFRGKTTFQNASADNGGALDVGSGATATFEGEATFTNNIATGDGGAINSAGTVTFSK
ncbi:MAG: hypothetical protein IJP88_12345, partial [Synergistaceae bacterium]|nr:hypothetical protein [Synergistaceae bacterium]